MRRPVLCALIGVVVLAASGCGGGGKGAAVVERDFARIRRTFSSWHAFPYGSTCPDTAGGSPTAEADAAYSAPPQLVNTVYVFVSYRSPANARRHFAGFAAPARLRCRKLALEADSITEHPGGVSRSPTVRLTPGVPGWLTQLLGHHVQGYRQLEIPPFGLPRIYGLLFIYTDPTNPHVTYSTAIDVSSPLLHRLDPQAIATQERDVLRLMHAIR